MERKKEIRRLIRKLRQEQGEELWRAKTDKITQTIVNYSWFLEAENIYCYADFDGEVGTSAVLETAWKLRKNVYLPYVEGSFMEFYRINSFEELERGTFGILEPKKACRIMEKKAGGEEALNGLMIMPGVAFDKDKNRIGYGGGYYDRYLNLYPKLHTIAAAFEFQVIDRIMTEQTDQKPDLLVTERGML